MNYRSATPIHTLTPRELAQRLGISEKKLAHDRLAGRGIPFLKIGRLCRYRISDVVAFETAQLRNSTSDAGALDV